MYISPFASSLNPIGYSPAQMRTAYNLPSSGGVGTTIAIIDAYDTPSILSYFNTFSGNFSLPDNSTGNFLVHKMDQNIRTDSGWALETCLDVEWAHAIAPNATILLVEAVSNDDGDLLSAVDYGAGQPGVVAVSMSWGDTEFSGETSFDSHFNKAGVTFFASSGDDGKYVNWPAVSANVVSVGGTTLNLNGVGTVLSEVAWSNSSGGISNYVASPAYQTTFGLTSSNRSVPDVSYYANTSPGVSVYNGTWWQVGGTSAGAPQWAAIDALGLTATNTNLYARAKAAYSSYFRDITSGSNYVSNATIGYDLVTGLGSPLTAGFGTEVTVSPSSGPSGGAVAINGVNFLGSSVNLSYLNPLNSSWIPIVNNLTTTAGNFVYTISAPDLLQNNPAGDNPPAYDNIVFRAQDNSNGRSYNTTVPYTEWRRGLSQIGAASASGLFGNNTNLAATLFVQNGSSMVVSGNWFTPGTASFFWDDTISLGTAAIAGDGSFNATVQVPSSTAGQHKLTVNDGNSSFCVNLTPTPTATPTPSSTPTPSPTPTPTPTATPTPSSTPTPTPSPSPTPSHPAESTNATPTLTNSPTTQPTATPQAPELNLQMVLILLAASTLPLILLFKKKRK
jgi:hypothetical protein